MEKRGICSYARTGFFKVGAKKYYAWPDERGYLMRSDTRWIVNKWYSANAAGALTNANNQTAKHIGRYVAWAVGIAKDDSHGYDQNNRLGPNYDCSSFLANGLIEGGFKIKASSTTSTLYSQLKDNGFKKCTKPWKRGDIHLSVGHHVVTSTDKDHVVHASINEKGTVTGGKSGDQTGKEICIRSYYEHPSGWDYHLRYTSPEDKKNEETSSKYYKAYTGKSKSIVDALTAVGVKDTSVAHRLKIAKANGIKQYRGSSAENLKLLDLLKKGKLIKA